MAALTLGLFFKALIASSPYFPAKIESTVLNSQKLCKRLAVGTARIISIIEKTKRRLHDRKTNHF